MTTEPIMQFFKYDHLPPNLQVVSKPFGELAQMLVDMLPRNPERSTALRKLLEAKDAAVRASIFVEPEPKPSGWSSGPPPLPEGYHYVARTNDDPGGTISDVDHVIAVSRYLNVHPQRGIPDMFTKVELIALMGRLPDSFREHPAEWNVIS